ncbi:MAG: 5-formyltetrahydrofolate cyclo-ligase [Steroidobacteraceae bacterium]
MVDRPALRRRLRAARRAVPAGERPAAAAAIDVSLARLGLPRAHSRISAYHAVDGEIDPSILLHRATALGCKIYYPVVTDLRARRMRFVASADAEATASTISPRWLDLVLVPLVGFDDRGNRLGMGAGFYDRHFAFLKHRRAWRRPILIGLAFDVQRVDRLAEAAHDVPLWGVVTERGIYGPAAAHARTAGGIRR